jgi:hypothetical protein
MNLEIKPGADLIIFDEIQASNRALNSLKYFAEQKNNVHIAAAGSLLGVKLSVPGSFPVGKVNFLYLYPMTFLEFLDAMGESRYRKLLENIDAPVPIAEAFHLHLIDMLRCYYFVGGMPEAVNCLPIQAMDIACCACFCWPMFCLFFIFLIKCGRLSFFELSK